MPIINGYRFPSHVKPIATLSEELQSRIRKTVQRYATERIAYMLGHGRDIDFAIKTTLSRCFDVPVLERKKATKSGRYVILNIFKEDAQRLLRYAVFYTVAWEANESDIKQATRDAQKIVKQRGQCWHRKWIVDIY